MCCAAAAAAPRPAYESLGYRQLRRLRCSCGPPSLSWRSAAACTCRASRTGAASIHPSARLARPLAAPPPAAVWREAAWTLRPLKGRAGLTAGSWLTARRRWQRAERPASPQHWRAARVPEGSSMPSARPPSNRAVRTRAGPRTRQRQHGTPGNARQARARVRALLSASAKTFCSKNKARRSISSIRFACCGTLAWRSSALRARGTREPQDCTGMHASP